MFNIFNSKGNKNKNYTEFTSHPNQNGCYQEKIWMKEGSGGGEFKYDIFDTVQELLQILHCTPSTTIMKKK
jgi:hypothetical protein